MFKGIFSFLGRKKKSRIDVNHPVTSSSTSPLKSEERDHQLSKELLRKTLEGVRKVQNDLESIRASQDKTYFVLDNWYQKNVLFNRFVAIVSMLAFLLFLFYVVETKVSREHNQRENVLQRNKMNDFYTQQVEMTQNLVDMQKSLLDEMKGVYRKTADSLSLQQGFSENMASKMGEQNELLQRYLMKDDRSGRGGLWG